MQREFSVLRVAKGGAAGDGCGGTDGAFAAATKRHLLLTHEVYALFACSDLCHSMLIESVSRWQMPCYLTLESHAWDCVENPLDVVWRMHVSKYAHAHSSQPKPPWIRACVNKTSMTSATCTSSDYLGDRRDRAAGQWRHHGYHGRDGAPL
jgi:hypothetical protein